MVAAGTSLYILCGWRGQHNAPVYLSDVFVYETVSSLWSPVRTAGIPPVARAYAGAACHRGQLYMFGGCNGTLASNYRNDLMLLDLSTFCWTICVPSTSPPLGRAHHSMCAFGGRLFVFGGAHLAGGKRTPLADLCVFDPGPRAWSAPADPAGPGPPARCGHGMCAAHGAVFVYGGATEGDEGGVLGCLWAFNPVSRRWHLLPSRSAPARRLARAPPRPARGAAIPTSARPPGPARDAALVPGPLASHARRQAGARAPNGARDVDAHAAL
jgi:hypothetical protein